jgi:hypothetical protein
LVLPPIHVENLTQKELCLSFSCREENMAMPRVPGQHVPPAAKEYDEDEEEHTETFCGSCGDLYIGSN